MAVTEIFDTSIIPLDNNEASIVLRAYLADYLKIWQSILDSATLSTDIPASDRGQRGTSIRHQVPLRDFSSFWVWDANTKKEGSGEDSFLKVDADKMLAAEDKFEQFREQWFRGTGEVDVNIETAALNPRTIATRIDTVIMENIDNPNWGGLDSIQIVKHGDYEPTRTFHDHFDDVWRGETEDGDYVNPFAGVTPPWEKIRSMILKGTPQKEVMAEVLSKPPGEFAEILQGYLNDEPYPNDPTGAVPQLHMHVTELLRQATLFNPEGVRMLLSGEFLDRSDGKLKNLPKDEHEKILKYLPEILNSSRGHEKMLGEGRTTSPKEFLEQAMVSAVKRTASGESLNNMNLGWGGTLSPETNMLLQQRYGEEILVDPENDKLLSEVLGEIEQSDPRMHDQMTRNLYFNRTPLGPDAPPVPARPLASRDPDAVTYVPEIVSKERGLVSQNLNSQTMSDDEKALKLMDIHTNLDQAMIDLSKETAQANVQKQLSTFDHMTEQIKEIVGGDDKLREEVAYSTYAFSGPPEPSEYNAPPPSYEEDERKIGMSDTVEYRPQEFTIDAGTRRGRWTAKDKRTEEYRRSVLENMQLVRKAKDPDNVLAREAEREKAKVGAGFDNLAVGPEPAPSTFGPPTPPVSDAARKWLIDHKNKPAATQAWADIKGKWKDEARTLPEDYLERNPVDIPPQPVVPARTITPGATREWANINQGWEADAARAAAMGEGRRLPLNFLERSRTSEPYTRRPEDMPPERTITPGATQAWAGVRPSARQPVTREAQRVATPGATRGWSNITEQWEADARTLPSNYLQRNPVNIPREYTPNEVAAIDAVQAWVSLLDNLKKD